MTVECVLLTWHGTVVCAEAGHPQLSHAPLTSLQLPPTACHLSVATDDHDPAQAAQALSGAELRYASELLGLGIASRSGGGPGYHFSRGGLFLCASGHEPWVEWNRERAEIWETFLPVSVETVQGLLGLRRSAWINLATSEDFGPERIQFQREFMLALGNLTVSLAAAQPKFFRTEQGAGAKESMFMITHDNVVHAFASTNDVKAPENALWLRNSEHDPSADPPDDRMPAELRAAETLYYPPTFADRHDRAYFTQRAVHGRPRVGFTTSVSRIRRASDVHLLLGRTVEGTLCGDNGVIRHFGFLQASANLPPGLVKLEDRFYLERSLYKNAPFLKGDYLVFYNGNLQNYFHWLVEGIIVLYLLRKAHGHGAKIVLPSALGEASGLPYQESLALLGLNDIEQVVRPEPVVQLERAYWIDAAGDLLENLPEQLLVELQAEVSASLHSTRANTRVYVERERFRKVKNSEQVRNFFEARGFVTVRLDGLPMVEQARVFASAEFIAGPHGAGLSNLIFTPPHARVIEFIPNTEMRSFFWLISSKLGHEYAMLPCQSETGGFNDDMQVDMTKLTRLFDFLEHA